MRFLIFGRSDGLKKKNTKKTHKSRNRRPWYPRTTVKVNIHIFGLTNAEYTVKNVPVFLYAVTMLIFQIRRIISNEKWFNYIVTLFFENAKNLGRSDDAKRRKKRGWPNDIKASICIPCDRVFLNLPFPVLLGL